MESIIKHSTILNYDYIYKTPWYKKKITWIIASVFLAVLFLFFPVIAWAAPPWPWDWLKIGEVIAAQINGMLIETINTNFWQMMQMSRQMATDGTLIASWYDLFNSGSSFYNLIVNISNGAVKPIAGGILSCVFLMQFIIIAGKSNADGTLPYFREMMVLFVMLTIFTWLVANADGICGMIYSIINEISKAIGTQGLEAMDVTQDFIGGVQWGTEAGRSTVASANFGMLLIIMLIICLGGLISWAASIVVVVMVFARAVQLYLYAAFSPIPLSVLGFDETRNWGVGFFKSFIAIALAGAIMLFIIIAFPHFQAAILGGRDLSQSILDISMFIGSEDSFIDMGGAMALAGRCICGYILLILGILKSGSWAREIMGG